MEHEQVQGGQCLKGCGCYGPYYTLERSTASLIITNVECEKCVCTVIVRPTALLKYTDQEMNWCIFGLN